MLWQGSNDHTLTHANLHEKRYMGSPVGQVGLSSMGDQWRRGLISDCRRIRTCASDAIQLRPQLSISELGLASCNSLVDAWRLLYRKHFNRYTIRRQRPIYGRSKLLPDKECRIYITLCLFSLSMTNNC